MSIPPSQYSTQEDPGLAVWLGEEDTGGQVPGLLDWGPNPWLAHLPFSVAIFFPISTDTVMACGAHLWIFKDHAVGQ